MTNIIHAEPGYFVVIATLDWDDDETPLLVEDHTWPVVAWRQRKDQSHLEPVTVVDLQTQDSHWCLVAPDDRVIDRTGREFRDIEDWQREILRHAAGAELVRNAPREAVVEASP